MKEIYFKQCKLIRRVLDGVIVTTSYIPEKHAIISKTLRLKNDDGTWTDGWMVLEVYGERIAESLLPDSHDGIKEHRKRTGDSLPKYQAPPAKRKDWQLYD